MHAKRKPKNDITSVCDQLLVPIARDSYIVNDRRCQLRFKEIREVNLFFFVIRITTGISIWLLQGSESDMKTDT